MSRTEHEARGYWWLPDSPDLRLAGTIKYGLETSPELRLFGSLQGGILEAMRKMGTSGAEFRPEIILGITERGRRFTLYSSLELIDRINFSGFVSSRYIPHIIIEGEHFKQANELRFEEFIVRPSHLDDWFQQTGKKIEQSVTDSSSEQFTLSYTFPEHLWMCFEAGQFKLSHGYNLEYRNDSGNLEFSERAYITICPNESVHVLDFLSDLLPAFVYLIALGIGKPVTLMEINCRVKRIDEEAPKKVNPSVTLHWQRKVYPDVNAELLSPFLIFGYPDVCANFECMARKWISAFRRLRPVMDLFFSKVLERESISANSFLNAIQATEAYHRYSREGKDLPDDIHAARVKIILESTPQEHNEWLKQKLAYSNEKGLRRRLCELLLERESMFSVSTKKQKDWAHRIVEIRNHYVHRAGGKEGEFATGSEFYMYEQILKWLIIACFLEELGMTQDEANQRVSKSQDFLSFKHTFITEEPVALIKVEEVSEEDVPKKPE